MPGNIARPRLAIAVIGAMGALAACTGAPSKVTPARPTVAAAPAAPVACQEELGKRAARVAGGQTVSLTTCARPVADWAAERPGIDGLRPHLNP